MDLQAEPTDRTVPRGEGAHIRILHVEDSSNDSELMRVQLERSGLALELVRVETEAGLIDALNRGDFDLVIADFTLPSFDGQRCLEITRANRPEVPFLFYSGTLGEEAAIESLQNGASDYVLKQRPARLVAAVQRSLQQAAAERHQRQMAEELSLKNKIANIFLTVTGDSMFGEVLRTIVDVTQSEDGVFGYVDKDGALACAAVLRATAEPRIVTRLPREEWIGLWKVLAEKRAVCTNDGGSFLPLGQVPIQRLLISPILYQEEIIGHFAVANKASDYNQHDLRLLEEIAAYVAPVLKVRLQRDMHEWELSKALEAKEVLLQEVHHRVKNNLQIISSLLNMQAKSLPQALQTVLHDSQTRITTMALVHEQLHEHGNVGDLDFANYAKRLTSDLWNAYQPESARIQLRFELPPVRLSASQSIPCGLILNELLTNAFKHAFPDHRTGEILVSLQCNNTQGEIQLRVADNGVGLPRNFSWDRANSLGVQIVGVLARQMHARFQCATGKGVDCTLSFTQEEVKPSSLLAVEAA